MLRVKMKSVYKETLNVCEFRMYFIRQYFLIPKSGVQHI